jgi:murein DD-endopeptidase MepM/ murein hydrolase activator NlpD
MARRVALCLGLGLLLLPAAATPRAGADSSTDLQSRIAAARSQEAALKADIASVTTKIRRLERQEVDVSRKLSVLERDLALHRRRLDQLRELYRLQSENLVFLRAQYKLAVRRLSLRIIEVYESGNPSTFEIAIQSESLRDLIDSLNYANAIGNQDATITNQVGQGRDRLRVARVKTRAARNGMAAETRVIAVRTSQVRQVHEGLLIATHSLSNTRSSKQQSLAAVRQQEKEFVGEANALAAPSRAIAAQLRSSGSSGPVDSTVSSHGLIWPVNGPVTSPFGMRWGRMHEGIDIGVGYGTPIHAAAGGTVVYAGWESDYGNFVVIDHGGGLATAYGHQSAIAVHLGEPVSQGQVIGYVGCTGHCFGPHLHFEVRINGTAVDPLGYL